MKIVCENCNAKYAISDGKVSNRVFKLKCKKCKQFIIVRGPQGESSSGDLPSGQAAAEPFFADEAAIEEGVLSALTEQTDVQDTEQSKTNERADVDGASEKGQSEKGMEGGAPPAKDNRVFKFDEFEGYMNGDAPPAEGDDDGETPWYLVIDGEQVGPVTLEELSKLVEKQASDSEVFIWREGFSDWKPPAEVEELAALVSSASADEIAGAAETEEKANKEWASVPTPDDESASVLPGIVPLSSSLVGTDNDDGASSPSQEASGREVESPSPFMMEVGKEDKGDGGETTPPLEDKLPFAAADDVIAASVDDDAPPAFTEEEPDEPKSSFSSPRINSMSQLTAERHEDSVLFSLSALGEHTFSTKETYREEPDDLEESSLAGLGLSDLASSIPAEKKAKIEIDVADPEPLQTVLPVAMVRPKRSPVIRIVLMVLSGALLMGLGIGVAYVVLKKNQTAMVKKQRLGPIQYRPTPGFRQARILGTGLARTTVPSLTRAALLAETRALARGVTSTKENVVARAVPSGSTAEVRSPVTVPRVTGKVETVRARREVREVRRRARRQRRAGRVARRKSWFRARAARVVREVRKTVPVVARRRVVETRRVSVAVRPPVVARRAKVTDKEIHAILSEAFKSPTARRQVNRAARRIEVRKAVRSGPRLPETLSREQVSIVVNKNIRKIYSCYYSKVEDKTRVKGNLQVVFKILRSGRVKSVQIKRMSYWGPALGYCIKKKILRWRFPKFSGDNITIKYPFVLGGL